MEVLSGTLDQAYRAAGVSLCRVSPTGAIVLDSTLAARLGLSVPCRIGEIVARCDRGCRSALFALAWGLHADTAETPRAEELRADLRLLPRDGEELWLRVIAPCGGGGDDNGSDGRGTQVLALLDVTGEQQAIDRLRESEKHWRRIVEYNPQWPWIADSSGRIMEITDRWLNATGLSLDRALKDGWYSLTHPDDVARVAHDVASAMARGDPINVTTRMMLDGEYRWLRSRAYPHRDEHDRISRWYGYTEDIHDRTLIEERIRWNAEHDALTGLTNRAHFNTLLEQALGSSLQKLQRVGVLLIDLDRFKEVNDLLGHPTGDDLLVGYTEQMIQALPPGAVAARVGGDEFAVMLTDIGDVQALLDCAESIRAIKQSVAGPGGQIECRASIGASLYPEHGRNASELIRHADIALYAAKRSGRARSLIYEPQMHHEVRERTAMVSRARSAALNGDVLAYYQPKVSLDTGALTGFEALLRWRDRSGKVQPPGSIAAAFGDPEVADLLGKAMLGKVIADLRSWTRAGLDYGSVAINVASAELRRGGFAPHLIATLQDAGLRDGAVEVEVTEGVFLGRGADEARRAIDMLHEAGIPLSLDDFGTGFASLSHLRTLPIDAIKIDRSFIAHIAKVSCDGGTSNPRNSDQAIVAAIVSLGRNLGMKVIAEGIETPEQAQVLRDFGCKYAQGYYFGMPTPAVGIPHLIRSWGGSEDDAIFAPRRILSLI